MKKSANSPFVSEIRMLGVKIHLFTPDLLHQVITSSIESKGKCLIPHINVYGMNIAYEQQWFRDFINSSDYVFCDGDGVIAGARILGHKIPCKITYAEWLYQLSEFCSKKGHSIFFLGASPGTADKAAANLKMRFPAMKVAGCHHGFFDKYGAENDTVINLINKAQPDILLVCFGMPTQEKWLSENWSRLNVHVGLTGGAALDYAAGELKRAPEWMVNHHMEWLGRLIIEPRRLWKRYVIGNPLFFSRIIRELCART